MLSTTICLFKKLKYLGFDPASIEWFVAYLSERTQITSEAKPLKVSLPQGRIFGPVLFLIYENDLPSCLEHCKVLLYADDLLHYAPKSAQDIQHCLNMDLQNLSS